MNENQNNIASLYPEDMEYNPQTMSFSPAKKETYQQDTAKPKANLSQLLNANNPLLAMLGANKNNALASLLSNGNKNNALSSLLGKDKNELLMQALSNNLNQKTSPKNNSPEPTFEEF